jgi:hypothetical protein
MGRTPGQKLALEMLKETEAGATRLDIAATHGIGDSAVYFQLHFAKFLTYRKAEVRLRVLDDGSCHYSMRAKICQSCIGRSKSATARAMSSRSRPSKGMA